MKKLLVSFGFSLGVMIGIAVGLNLRFSFNSAEAIYAPASQPYVQGETCIRIPCEDCDCSDTIDIRHFSENLIKQ